VHAVVAGVGLVAHTQLLPGLEHHVAQRALGGLLGVGGAQDCSAGWEESRTGAVRKSGLSPCMTTVPNASSCKVAG
jgi:hypothetical protein